MAMVESARMFTRAVVEKYDDDQTKWVAKKSGILAPEGAQFKSLGLEPYEVAEGPQPGNRLVTAGLNLMTSRLTTAEQVWDETHVALAVGDSSTGDAIGDTDMVAATNKYYRVMDSSFPTQANGVLTFRATYGSGIAEFAWNEYGVIIPDTSTVYTSGTTKQASYVLFNRKAPASLGTKSSGTWVFTVTITVT